jgi:hypothetical protein
MMVFFCLQPLVIWLQDSVYHRVLPAWALPSNTTSHSKLDRKNMPPHPVAYAAVYGLQVFCTLSTLLATAEHWFWGPFMESGLVDSTAADARAGILFMQQTMNKLLATM